jgi:hypothetical protein
MNFSAFECHATYFIGSSDHLDLHQNHIQLPMIHQILQSPNQKYLQHISFLGRMQVVNESYHGLSMKISHSHSLSLVNNSGAFCGALVVLILAVKYLSRAEAS